MKKAKSESLFLRRVPSLPSLCFIAAASGGFVFAVAVFFQWLVYDDWLHDQGSLRLVGSLLAGAIMFAVTLARQIGRRRREIEIQQHLETLLKMNDRIRNSLQTIECVTYATSPLATEPVRLAVDTIEEVLDELMVDTRPLARSPRTRPVSAEALRTQG